MVHTHTAHDQEANMPPSRRKPPADKGPKGKASTTTPVGDVVEPDRFSAGTGELAERMRGDFEETATRARAIRMQKLDAEGAPAGEGFYLPGEGTIDLTPTDMELRPVDPGPYEPGSVEVNLTVKDELSAAILRNLFRIPIPTAVVGERWFPAFVRWPEEDMPLAACKVYITPQGIYVYQRPPTEPETLASGARPDRYAPVLFEETGKPPIATVARNAGFRIQTPIGPVIVQPTGGCGCGNRLKHWSPDWARNVLSWDDGVKLAATATEGR